MGKYRVLRFEFPASSSPIFEFPAAENSAMMAENSDIWIHPSCPPVENLATMAENSDIWIHPSCPLADNLAMLAENSDIQADLSCPLAGNSSISRDSIFCNRSRISFLWR